jgi:hypothetical protein
MSKKLKITEEQLKRLVGNKSINENEGMESNYMFFSNLEQIHRQSKLMMELDEQKVNEILNNGHDWADDHVTVSKENLSQVFDFMMNEFKGSGDDENQSEKFVPKNDFSLNEEGDMNETSVGMVEMGLAKEVVPFIIEKLEERGIDMEHLDMGMFTRALHHEIINYNKEKEHRHEDMPGFEGTMDDLNNISIRNEDDSMMNESIKKIKSNFKRFL